MGYAEFEGAKKVKEIEEAMNKALANVVFSTQGALSRAAPVKTGRLASSFFIGKDSPSREVEPFRKNREPVTITREYNRKEITIDSDWYISNNLPYAEIVATDPAYGKNGRVNGAAWFTTIANGLPNKVDSAFVRQLRKVK